MKLHSITAALDITSTSVDAALEAAKCYMKLSGEAKRLGLKPPSLFEAIVLAKARLLKAKVLTGDEHFKNLSETLSIEND